MLCSCYSFTLHCCPIKPTIPRRYTVKTIDISQKTTGIIGYKKQFADSSGETVIRTTLVGRTGLPFPEKIPSFQLVRSRTTEYPPFWGTVSAKSKQMSVNQFPKGSNIFINSFLLSEFVVSFRIGKLLRFLCSV